MARRRKRSGWQAILLALLLIGFFLYDEGYLDPLLRDTPLARPTLTPAGGPQQPGTGQEPGTAQPPAAVPQLEKAFAADGSWFQVYFTRPTYPEQAAERHGGVDAALIADIDAARQSVEVAVFEFELDSIAEALLRAHQRGVRVRLVTDDEPLEDPHAAELIGRLQEAGIGVTFDERSAFMHIKMLIVDDTLVWTGSMNFTPNDVYRNNNNMLRFAIPQLTADYKQRFEWLFSGRPAGQPAPQLQSQVLSLHAGERIANYFSPDGGAAQAIEQRLSTARRSIRTLAFAYTADPQAQILIQKHQAGLAVQGVFESRNSGGSGADFEMLQQAGVDVLEDGNCYTMHNKTYIIDEQTVITGSYNFTASAERSNDENLLIIDDPALAQLYLQEFQRIYDQARDPLVCGR